MAFTPAYHKITCPFCFAHFSLQEAQFRCINPGCPDMGPDNEYALRRGLGRIKMGRVLLPEKRKGVLALKAPDELFCNTCKEYSTTRICPTCHFELPSNIAQTEQKVIAIIGGRATGKSHYIASLIHRLTHSVGQGFDVSVSILGDDSQARWTRDFYTPLFEQRRILNPTLPSALDAQVLAPIIFRLLFGGGNGRQRRALNLSFFDTAGEDMTSHATLSTYSHYICDADGIIFLLDPLQMSGVRQKISNQTLPELDLAAAPDNIVRALRELFERVNNIGATQKIKTPIAFTLSKIDMLAAILDDPGSPLLQSSTHSGNLNLNEIQSLHTDIQHRLYDWLSPNFCKYVHEHFANYQYFGISSLGQPPDTLGHVSSVSPRRVEEPFLWLLYKNNLIKGQKM
ncbi:TRAFAC clade GTPase domain-containing protein [Dictyobacter formicarum]|uniref:Double-GTPase 2 domain-containing protein n=1 Tax=Dictyobacter formicarum TaxID=2778368 RepID=A0ABQ3VKA8_9CHLR|nr:hypothetical protein [Dictyobacter formicarum]GHO86347.1 hypothetical protein KSZ_43530 [Dictyobacter formicarum]